MAPPPPPATASSPSWSPAADKHSPPPRRGLERKPAALRRTLLRAPCDSSLLGRVWENLCPAFSTSSVRLSVQFLHGDTPCPELAVWACVVPRGIYDATPCPIWTWQLDSLRVVHLHHHACLARLSSPPLANPPSVPLIPTAFPPSFRIIDQTCDVYHLRLADFESSFAVAYAVARPGQPDTHFGRSGPHHQLPGQHVFFSDNQIFVALGHQDISLSAFTDLESGYLLGTFSSLPISNPVLYPPRPFHGVSTDPPTADVHVLHDNTPAVDDAASSNDTPFPPKMLFPELLEGLSDSRRTSFRRIWDRLTLHVWDVTSDLHGSFRSPGQSSPL